MTCRDVGGLLPLFLDGELDARRMRTVALHSSRCVECEGELRRLERLQDLVGETIHARVEELDLGQIWPGVQARLGTVRVSWWQRCRIWWEERDPTWWIRVPAVGLAAAAAVLAFVVWSGDPGNVAQPVSPVAAVDNSATIDSLDSTASAVAVLNEPETNTTVLWVNDDTDYGPEGFPP